MPRVLFLYAENHSLGELFKRRLLVSLLCIYMGNNAMYSTVYLYPFWPPAYISRFIYDTPSWEFWKYYFERENGLNICFYTEEQHRENSPLRT